MSFAAKPTSRFSKLLVSDLSASYYPKLTVCQYEFERRKYAQDLINFDKKFSALFSGKPRTEDNQDGVSHEEFLT